jgi:hypothetical protein
MEDPADELSSRLGHGLPLRPAVAVRLATSTSRTPKVMALVDGGSERTLAAPWMARALNVDLGDAIEGPIGIGGGPRRVRFTSARIELFEHQLGEDEDPIATWDADIGFLTSWEPQWGMVLGQRGLFDQFTVTMHRHAQALVLESWAAFDDRFGVQIEEADDHQPRFRP